MLNKVCAVFLSVSMTVGLFFAFVSCNSVDRLELDRVSKTEVNVIKYYFVKKKRLSKCSKVRYVEPVDLSAYSKEIHDAFRYIESSCNVKYVQVNNYRSADLVIGKHNFENDSVQAAASTSGYSVNFIHFSDSNNWQVDFYEVFVHEIGHTLGLRHSNNKKSVMYGVSNGRTKFDSRDIYILTRKYGRPILN